MGPGKDGKRGAVNGLDRPLADFDKGKTIDINLNWEIGLKLNPIVLKGRAAYWESIGLEVEPLIPDIDGYYWIQLHRLHEFGLLSASGIDSRARLRVTE